MRYLEAGVDNDGDDGDVSKSQHFADIV